MPIKIKGFKPLESDNIYVPSEVRIFNLSGETGDSPTANMTCVIKSSKGEIIGKRVFLFKDHEYNSFWENFNSGKYLYEVISEKLGLKMDLDDSLEADFITTHDILGQPLAKEPVVIKKPVSYVRMSKHLIICAAVGIASALISHYFWK